MVPDVETDIPQLLAAREGFIPLSDHLFMAHSSKKNFF